ncbi:arsenate reductase/protein-tyrosine-phosphatase family protein [Pantoea eucalypti]|jgi:protein-tyrosine phosphatase|uniref:protein-tyrosine-phosphatase n=1 Tax=Pantoea eucalypti TaxID=470933 RepID=A0ABY2ZFF8_9GAMM|nr:MULTISPECIES: protein-tyrosine-phosphatase [Pantoea]PQL29471.1 protein tyrosine phosphatase [Pantoea ananatis]QXG55791.1 protein tyrosine phosphatase [Pantoea jilinensis]AWP32370.1 protein tyrosine phosphatase [Pantoea vagans]EFM19421.1 protein tyrosine phosphatase [Pantoea sp. aB]MBD9551850.1 protein tyrosine phosphatase [Pantoea sp. PNT01]
MITSVLVVCIGNICRSPTGERLFKRALPDLDVRSAGLGALVGHAADRMASEVAAAQGLSLEGHQAQQLTAEMCRQADLILVMEKRHIEQVNRIDPAARGKTMLLGHWLNQKEIADPYRKSREAFEEIYGLLENATQKWVNVLSR